MSEEEYVEANAMYMAAGEMDKDEFCREWMQFGQSRLVQCLYNTAYNLNKALQEQKLMTNECQEMLSDAADAMLEIADGLPVTEHTTQELNKKAWWLVGQTEVTRRKVQKGYRLDDKDRETIINNLMK